MPQLNKGETFADGQQVTGVRLNNLVDGATILPGVITDQVNLAANTVASGDSVLLHDLSAGALREATASDLLNSNLPISTSSITGGAGVDLTITPAAGNKANVAGAFQVTGNSEVTGNQIVNGNLTVNGTISGNINSSGNLTNSGIVNLTGAFQVNGATAYVLTEIYEETIPHYGSIAVGISNAVHITSSFTKPVGEIWQMEISLRYYGAAGYVYEFAGRYGSETPQTGAYLFYERRHDGAGGGAVGAELYTCRWIVPSAQTFTSETIKIDTNAGSGSGLQIGMQTGLPGTVCSGAVYPSKFRIYKYKTA